MNSSYYQHQLDRKRKERATALKRASDLGSKQADKQGKATKKAAAAGSASSPTVGKRLPDRPPLREGGQHRRDPGQHLDGKGSHAREGDHRPGRETGQGAAGGT